MNEEEMNGIDNEVLLIVMSVELLYLLDGIVLDIVELILVSVELMYVVDGFLYLSEGLMMVSDEMMQFEDNYFVFDIGELEVFILGKKV